MTTRDHLGDLGRKIANMRNDKGLSQDELATASGIHRVTIAKIETGKSNLSVTNLRRIAVALETTMEVLVAGIT